MEPRQTGSMRDVVKKTYLIVLKVGFNQNRKKLWVIDGKNNKYSFLSVDGKTYSLYISDRRPWPNSAIPYELFIKDEIRDV